MVSPSSSFLLRTLSCLCILLLLGAAADAQHREQALERARVVKMLSDGREAVRRIFHDFNLDRSDERSDEFSFGETDVEVTYSSGTCSEDDVEVWDLDPGRVVKIEIRNRSDWKLAELGINTANLDREQMYSGNDSIFILHSKSSGIAIEVVDDEIDTLRFFASVSTKAKRCRSTFAKEFIEHKSWFGSKKLEDRFVCVLVNGHANVTKLELIDSEVSAVTAKQIGVVTTAVDPENDVLTYNYTVSGGRIVGTGAKVKWDLSNVRPGSYSITAGVDDGCGLCGATMTKTVVVK